MKWANNWLLFAVLLGAVACDDTGNTGLIIQPEQDQIQLFTDTFGVQATNAYVNAISAQCDTTSMLLGEVYDKKFGTTKAELLVQLSPPIGYEFAPDSLNPTADSLVLYMYYSSWFGSSISPLELSIYEINKQSLVYDKVYYSNLNIADFTDESILMGKRTITSVDQTLADSVLTSDDYYPLFRYVFSTEQLNRFFNIPHAAYASQEAFDNYFKGLYITTKYGASTMMYFNQIDLKLFYHYTYNKNGQDTIVNTSIVYPANKEVRQLNKISHFDLEDNLTLEDSVFYVKAPAGIFPQVQFPIGAIRHKVKGQLGDKLFNVNSASLIAEATEIDESDMAMPIPTYMLLIKASKVADFITQNHVPISRDSIAVLATYDSDDQNYVFDMSYFLDYEVRRDENNFTEVDELVMIPVSVTLNSSGSITSVRAQRKVGAVTLRSGFNNDSPLRVKIIYNGF